MLPIANNPASAGPVTHAEGLRATHENNSRSSKPTNNAWSGVSHVQQERRGRNIPCNRMKKNRRTQRFEPRWQHEKMHVFWDPRQRCRIFYFGPNKQTNKQTKTQVLSKVLASGAAKQMEQIDFGSTKPLQNILSEVLGSGSEKCSKALWVHEKFGNICFWGPRRRFHKMFKSTLGPQKLGEN